MSNYFLDIAYFGAVIYSFIYTISYCKYEFKHKNFFAFGGTILICIFIIIATIIAYLFS